MSPCRAVCAARNGKRKIVGRKVKFEVHTERGSLLLLRASSSRAHSFVCLGFCLPAPGLMRFSQCASVQKLIRLCVYGLGAMMGCVAGAVCGYRILQKTIQCTSRLFNIVERKLVHRLRNYEWCRGCRLCGRNVLCARLCVCVLMNINCNDII